MILLLHVFIPILCKLSPLLDKDAICHTYFACHGFLCQNCDSFPSINFLNFRTLIGIIPSQTKMFLIFKGQESMSSRSLPRFLWNLRVKRQTCYLTHCLFIQVSLVLTNTSVKFYLATPNEQVS